MGQVGLTGSDQDQPLRPVRPFDRPQDRTAGAADPVADRCGVPRDHTDRLPAQCRCRHRGRTNRTSASERRSRRPRLRQACGAPSPHLPAGLPHGPLIPGCLAGLPIVGTALIRGVPAGFPKTRHLKSSSRTCMISQIALSGEPSSHAPAELRPPRTGRSERPPATPEPPHDPLRIGRAASEVNKALGRMPPAQYLPTTNEHAGLRIGMHRRNALNSASAVISGAAPGGRGAPGGGCAHAPR